jgi:cob(I)alamin adenosyltransferase
MSIITKRGDDGSTDLMFGKRISKTSTRIATLGAIDELNASLGLARAADTAGNHTETIDKVQNLLFGLMGELACEPGDEAKYHEKGYAALKQADLDWLTEVALAAEARGVRFTHWAVPGAECSMARAHLDLARTVSRRAERHLLMLHEESGTVPPVIRLFLNRLSDLLWILARAETPQHG